MTGFTDSILNFENISGCYGQNNSKKLNENKNIDFRVKFWGFGIESDPLKPKPKKIRKRLLKQKCA